MPPWSPSAAFCQLGPLNDRRGWDIDPSRFTDEWWADTAQRWTVTDSSHQMGHVGLVEVNGGTVHVDDITLRVVPRAEQASG